MAGSMIGTITGGAMGTVGGIFSSIAGMKWDKEMDKLKEKDPRYTSSPYAADNLGMAQTLLNSRMAGAANREKNILTSGANVRSGISRNATDASQALALMAGTQGQSDQSFNDLQMQEGQDAMMKQNNLFNANKDMTGEHDKLFDDEVRRWQDQVNMITAQYKARQAGGQSFTNMGGAAQAGMSGGGGMMSDKRLKHNYRIVGKSKSGINIYQFSYLGSSDRFEGVMADEVENASFMTESGFYAVDYSKIDVQFKYVI